MNASKHRKLALRALCWLILAFVAVAKAAAEQPIVYVFNLGDEVGEKTWRQTQRACREATKKNADFFVLHINTYGGAVDAADSIRTAIMRLPMPTIAFVDKNAASAGALITLACDSVYMAPGASYGASTVVNQNGEPMPDKYQSYMKSIMRSTAESHGKYWSIEDSAWKWRRDPSIAERMVTPDNVLTLTPEEAISVGYAEGMATSVDEVISFYVQGDYKKEEFNSTLSDSILGFLASAPVRAILIMLILAGIYMEMHTPGLGVAAGIAFVCAILYFLPSIVTGTMAAWVIIVFIIGIVLLALELFVIPGFGVCGIAAIIAIMVALVGGMLNGNSIQSEYALDMVNALSIAAIGLVLSVAAMWFLTSKYGPKRLRRIAELQTEQKVSEGYIGVDMSQARYVGKTGKAITDLRPAGKIEIDNKEFDAVSLSGFIDAHKPVKAVKYENAQLYVRIVDTKEQ